MRERLGIFSFKVNPKIARLEAELEAAKAEVAASIAERQKLLSERRRLRRERQNRLDALMQSLTESVKKKDDPNRR